MSIRFKKLNQLFIIVALFIFFAGCSEKSSMQENTAKDEVLKITKSQQLQELTFVDGISRAIIIFEDDAADILIYAKGLDSNVKYRISLIGDNGASPGVMFGPIENVKLRVGSLEDEVMFKPNSEGELFMSMRNPIRILTAAKKELYFKIESENKKVNMKTSSFLVNK